MSLLNEIKRLYGCRAIIAAMAVHELKARYAGTLAGSLWAIVNPLITILVYWFVFSVGLKVKPMGDVPFILFFSVGLIPWTTFSEALTLNANAVVGNAYLVKKMVFPTEVLPLVNILAGLIVHVIMVALVTLIFLAYGFPVTVFNLQFAYYLFALTVFSTGLSWFVAALNVFQRDIGLIIGVALNIWFWLTPVVYGVEVLPPKYLFFARLNPMFYIIEGYRNSFLYGVPFWHGWKTGIYFWSLSLSALYLGALFFRRFKNDFAEVL
ncbi:MAG: ABC transporter permease [Deltaproteobacteria bacterium]|nr:ABC transporter permease [Deltaproteobacteria bacterium]